LQFSSALENGDYFGMLWGHGLLGPLSVHVCTRYKGPTFKVRRANDGNEDFGERLVKVSRCSADTNFFGTVVCPVESKCVPRPRMSFQNFFLGMYLGWSLLTLFYRSFFMEMLQNLFDVWKMPARECLLQPWWLFYNNLCSNVFVVHKNNKI